MAEEELGTGKSDTSADIPDGLQQLRAENERHRTEMIARNEALNRPQHNRNIDLSRASFKFDDKRLIHLDKVLSEGTGTTLSWTMNLEGSRTVHARSLREIIDEPVVETRSIQKMYGRGDGPPPALTQVSITLSERSGISFDVSSREPSKLAHVENQFLEIARIAKTPLTIAYFPVLLPLLSVTTGILCFTLAYRHAPGDMPDDARAGMLWMALMAGGFGVYVALSALRRALVPRVQFDIGRSKRSVALRTSIMRIIFSLIGVTMIGSVLQQLWVNFVLG